MDCDSVEQGVRSSSRIVSEMSLPCSKGVQGLIMCDVSLPAYVSLCTLKLLESKRQKHFSSHHLLPCHTAFLATSPSGLAEC